MNKFKNTVLVTGASGGMGRAIARRLGAGSNLVLTDIAEGPLSEFSRSLSDEGYQVSFAKAGDLSDDDLLASIVDACRDNNLMGVAHTAGLSPVQSNWKKIISVNTIASSKLMSAIEPVLGTGAAAVLIASMAAHQDPKLPEADAILDNELDATALRRLETILFDFGKTGPEAEQHAAQLAYILSKRATTRLAVKLAGAWGKRECRIVSVSPGLIFTPMGKKEADSSQHTADMITQQPLARWGTSNDIALAVEFLLSEKASFITGCDLKVDGGASTFF